MKTTCNLLILWGPETDRLEIHVECYEAEKIYKRSRMVDGD